jgi:general secretion pathway protein L
MRANAAAFAHWWGGELISFVPGRVRDLLMPVQTKLLIEINKQGQLKFSRVSPNGRQALRTIRSTPPDVTSDAVSPLRDLTRGVDSIVIALPESCGFRRHVELPEAARENLREVLTMEMDRLTPFKASDIYFTYRAPVAGRNKDQISIDLSIVPKQLADEVTQMVEGLGLQPDMLCLADDKALEQNLLTAKHASSSRRFTPVIAGSFAAVLAVLFIAVIAIPFVKQSIAIGGLEHTVDNAGPSTGESTAARQVVAWRRGAQMVSEVRSRVPATIAVLDELSKAIPKDTWLIDIDLSLDERKVTLSGYSANAAALIAPLENLDALKGVKFVEPVAFDDRQSRDRFRLTADIAAPGARQ